MTDARITSTDRSRATTEGQTAAYYSSPAHMPRGMRLIGGGLMAVVGFLWVGVGVMVVLTDRPTEAPAWVILAAGGTFV